MRPSWIENGFVPDQPTPSMDDKDTPSPPIRTVDDYHFDRAYGFERIGHAIYGSKKGLDTA